MRRPVTSQDSSISVRQHTWLVPVGWFPSQTAGVQVVSGHKSCNKMLQCSLFNQLPRLLRFKTPPPAGVKEESPSSTVSSRKLWGSSQAALAQLGFPDQQSLALKSPLALGPHTKAIPLKILYLNIILPYHPSQGQVAHLQLSQGTCKG